MRKLWTHFEYWPSWLLYIFALPIFIYGIVKTRKLTFFTAANPALPTGGFFGEDKTEINRCFSKKYFPTEFSVSVDDSLDEILSKISLLNISFPFFAKLKIGERGRGVAEIKDIDELIKYRHRYQNFYIQAKIINGEELGIFFIKKPWEKQGQITSIVTKKYPEIIGDGNSTITQLIAKDSRLRLYVKHLLPYIDNPNEILKNKEKKLFIK